MTPTSRDEIGLGRRVAERLRPLAAAIAALIVLAPPTVFYVLGGEALQASATIAATDLADKLSGVVFETPGLWKYQTPKYEQFLDAFLLEHDVLSIDVLDETGRSIRGYERRLRGWRASWRPVPAEGSAPIRFNNRTVGTVVVTLSDGPHLLGTLVLLLISAAAGATLAVVVYRFPLDVVRAMEGDIARRTAEQDCLIHAGRELAKSLEPDDVVRCVAEVAGIVLPADIVLVDLEGASGRRMTAQTGATVTAPAPLGWLAQEVATTAEPVSLDDVRGDPRVADGTWLAMEAVTSALLVPLVFDAKPCGLIAWLSRTPRAWHADEVAAAGALAVQAALAARNAELYGESVQALADLRVAQERLVRGATLQALGQMTAGAAHHLNNLLTVVQCRIEVLLADLRDPAARQSLAVVGEAVADAGRVLHRMQRFAHRGPLDERVLVDVNDVAAEAMFLATATRRSELQATGLAVTVDLKRAVIAPVVGSRAALTEAVTNIVLNAIDAVPHGGVVSMLTSQVGSRVRLEVIDPGVGMTPEVRQRAFIPFFTTKGEQRTGLGLSVAHGIVQEHDGTIDLESAVNRGTRVVVELPAADAAAATSRPPAPVPAEPPRRYRILVIDDDEQVSTAIASLLTRQGHVVHVATSGDEGLDVLERGELVDLVMTDLGMAAMSGWAVARAVTTRWPAIKVALITGWGGEVALDSGDATVIGVVSKPVSGDALRRLIARLEEPPTAP